MIRLSDFSSSFSFYKMPLIIHYVWAKTKTSHITGLRTVSLCCGCQAHASIIVPAVSLELWIRLNSFCSKYGKWIFFLKVQFVIFFPPNTFYYINIYSRTYMMHAKSLYIRLPIKKFLVLILPQLCPAPFKGSHDEQNGTQQCRRIIKTLF